jgi:hypothetical protein
MLTILHLIVKAILCCYTSQLKQEKLTSGRIHYKRTPPPHTLTRARAHTHTHTLTLLQPTALSNSAYCDFMSKKEGDPGAFEKSFMTAYNSLLISLLTSRRQNSLSMTYEAVAMGE